MKRVLLTGASGFIGAHCVKYFLEKTDWFIVALDSFRHKGTYSRLNELDIDPNRFLLIKHDLSVPIDEVLENRILSRTIDQRGYLRQQRIDYIINMASDSAVERSITNPKDCWTNNCEIAINMLELARKIKPSIFFQVSTDEVYGDCPDSYSHPEWDVIVPSNPYAASKAAQEALAISYWRTYDVPVVLTNCMNTIGVWQDKEKFLPKIIWKIATNQELEIYADNVGNGQYKIGSRFYLHAENHADIFIWLANRAISKYENGDTLPDRYNVVGDIELNNLELAFLVSKIMDKPLKYRLTPSESVRRGYDRRYALDGSKLKKAGWEPPIEFQEGLEKIVSWTLQNSWWV
jgi:dTDP-glucose 4,6-dehydratase